MKSASFIRVSLIITTLLLTACGDPNGSVGGEDTSSSLHIIPEECKLFISGSIGLTLNGGIDPNSKVNWRTDFGSIVNNNQGVGANYTAPPAAGEADIEATITSGINAETTVLHRICAIVDPSITAPATSPTSSEFPPDGKMTIVISEVMGNSCGGVEERRYNQYIELYNYGDAPVDVGGWKIFDEGTSGTPDELTAWSSRVNIQFDPGLVMNTTVIPPKGIALVLSPQYHLNPMKISYAIPAGTIILTVAQSDTLGDDYFGIIADQPGYDTVTLYIGGATIIETKVDTYGTPLIKSSYPIDIDDDHLDNIPMYLSECTSVERIDPRERDKESNWRPVTNGSPGEVPFP